jgi:hypothetical protein
MLRKKVYKISKERAIELAMNHNCVSREIAENYTDSELREVVLHISGGAMSFKLIADF